MRNTIKFYIISFLFIAAPLSALDGVAVIDMRTAVLSTQAAAEAFKALEEDSEYSSNLEEAKSLQADRQAIAEKLQKELETLSQEEIADKGRDLEFLAGKIQQAQEETAQAVFAQSGPAMQKIISELIAAKQIKVLLAKNETMLFSDPALDLTDDVTSMLDVAAAEATSQSE